MKTPAILNYGAGNPGSVWQSLKHLGVDAKIITPADIPKEKRHIIFPGVGAAQKAWSELQKNDGDKILREHVSKGYPLMGICVGMQLLGRHCQEGDVNVLGVFDYDVTHFKDTKVVPHMGWNDLVWNEEHPAAQPSQQAIGGSPNAYFVHSYAAILNASQASPQDFVLATTEYQDETIASFVARDNVWGTQFHTEKSGQVGLRILKQFLEL